MYKSIIDNLTDSDILNISESCNSMKDFTKAIGYSQNKVGKNTRIKIKKRLEKLGINFQKKVQDSAKEKKESVKEKLEDSKLKNISSEEIGALGEFSLINLAVINGIRVSKPIVDAYPYDLLLEYKGNVLKFQVKTSQSYDGKTIEFHLSSNLHNGSICHKYSKDEVDYFYLYNPLIKEGYIVKNNEKNISIVLRYDYIYKRSDMNLAEDYVATSEYIRSLF